MSVLVAGAPIGPFIVERVEPGPLKVLSLLARDPNPVHWDRAAVAAAGLGARIVTPGRLNAAWLAELAAEAAGGHAYVRRFTARFVGRIHEGDRVVCSGTVAAVDEGTATFELVASVDGEPRVTATAVALTRRHLPSTLV